MAMVPTYTNKASVPGSTGMQNVPLSLATSPLTGMGEGITQAASALDAAATRIQSREDVINSQRAMELFTQNEDLEFEKFEKDADLLNTDSVGAYQEGLKQRSENAINAFSLSSNAQAQLRANIGATGSTYFRNMLKTSLAAQETYTVNGVTTALESNLMPFDGDPKMDESKIKQQKAIVLKTVAERSVNLSSLKEQELIKEGNARVYNNAFNSYFASGNIAEAKKLINSKDYRLSVDDAQYRTSAKTLLDEEKRQRAGYDAGIKELQKQAAILGVTVESFTDAERRVFSSLGKANLKLTPAEKAAEWERDNNIPPPPELVDSWITGEETPASRIIQTNAIRKSLGQPPLNDEQLQRFNQVEKAAGNNTENERRMNFLVKNSRAYRLGQLSPEDARIFEMLAQDEYENNVKTLTDADGNIVVVSTPLDPNIQGALVQQGFKLQEPGRVTEKQTLEYTAPKIPENQTVFGMFKNAVGVGPGVATFAANIPFLGEQVSGESQIAQTLIRNANRRLVTAMQNNPRFSDGERKAIEQELDLNPRAITTAKAYFSRMVGIQSSVNRMIGEKYAIIYSEGVTKKQKDIAARQLVELKNYNEVMGMPLVVSGPDDERLLDLEPGETFVDGATGDIRTVKGSQ
tara:strand:+ start:754 stop:2658 length:1905 start_codon:yes stop_codon:yes gene_type:complete